MSPVYPDPDTATREEVAVWEREAFYDREIAPKLAAIAKECEARGMSFLARVEWAAGKSGSTSVRHPHTDRDMLFVMFADRANGNGDTLIMALMKYAREHGHESVCMTRLGVPEKPEPAKATLTP